MNASKFFPRLTRSTRRTIFSASSKDGLKLVLTIYQYSGDVHFDLFWEGIGKPVFRMKLLDCLGAKYVSTKEGHEYLEFAPAKGFGGRYDGESPIPMGVRLAVNPHIQVEVF